MKAKQLISRMILKTKKASPEILVTVGIVGIVATTVTACKATTKLSDILDKSQLDISDVENYVASEDKISDYTEEDAKKDKYIIRVQTAVKVTKLYAPSVALGIVSVGCILASNDILRKRGMAIAAAYTALDRGYKEYRSRVIERFGSEVDRELKYNIQKRVVKETVTDDKGKTKEVEKEVSIVPKDFGHSEYAKWFDEGSEYFLRDSEANLLFLRSRQQWCHDMLVAHGHLFLNDVYKELGLPITKAGQVVGWIYDPLENSGDNFVDFGIYNQESTSRDFINGYEKAILLDFNVDGVIWDRI